MQEFTKRHWRYSEMGNRVTQDDEKYLPIAEVYGCSFYPEEEYKANGRLMAAAPELYELVLDELRGEAGGILSFAREGKIRKIINRISGEETQA